MLFMINTHQWLLLVAAGLCATLLFVGIDLTLLQGGDSVPRLAAPRSRVDDNLGGNLRPPLNRKAVLADLSQSQMWGVKHDGSPLVPPPPPETEAQKKQRSDWQLLASVVRANERFILIRQGQKPPVRVNPGEALPDQRTLVNVDSHLLTFKDSHGKTSTMTVYQE